MALAHRRPYGISPPSGRCFALVLSPGSWLGPWQARGEDYPSWPQKWIAPQNHSGSPELRPADS